MAKRPWEKSWLDRMYDSGWFVPVLGFTGVALLFGAVLYGALRQDPEEKGQMIVVTCPCGSVMNVWVPPKPKPEYVPVYIPQ